MICCSLVTVNLYTFNLDCKFRKTWWKNKGVHFFNVRFYWIKWSMRHSWNYFFHENDICNCVVDIDDNEENEMKQSQQANNACAGAMNVNEETLPTKEAINICARIRMIGKKLILLLIFLFSTRCEKFKVRRK